MWFLRPLGLIMFCQPEIIAVIAPHICPDHQSQKMNGAWLRGPGRRIVLGFEGEKNMPKLNFSGNLPNTIRNNILKLPVIPAGAFSNIQDGVQDGRQNVNTAI